LTITRSIRFRLLVTILLSVLLLWSAVLCFTWWRTNSDISQVYDAELVQVAQLLAVATVHEAAEHDLNDYQADLSNAGYQFPLIFQIWSQQDRLMVRGPKAPADPLSASRDDGFADVIFNNAGWRVYTLNLTVNDFRIQVARSHMERDRMVNEFVIDVVKPLLIVIPLSGMLWVVVHRGLEPLRQVSRLIAERDYGHLNPVEVDHIPEESASLVEEINALLSRLRASIERNSRFTADVAHELRTPIAGMLVQLQSVDAGLSDEERGLVVDKVQHGLVNLNHVINQLLILASIEPEKIRQTFERIDLRAVSSDVLSELSPLALEKGIELELLAESSVFIEGNPQLINILLSNLISNAIKFTPESGSVIVHVANVTNGISLSVEDTGPGIPEEKKAWVFERLNKGSKGGGSGLGLSIVKEISHLHQASITLNDKMEDSGLIVTLFLPALSEA
jgi:two-component system, OmpR family, sensor histidine kinase QseC